MSNLVNLDGKLEFLIEEESIEDSKSKKKVHSIAFDGEKVDFLKTIIKLWRD
jgi:hypothetical protein